MLYKDVPHTMFVGPRMLTIGPLTGSYPVMFHKTYHCSGGKGLPCLLSFVLFQRIMNSVRTVVGTMTVFVIRCVAVLACSICSKVAELLDKRGIKLTSVDLVQFTWLDEKDDLEIQEGMMIMCRMTTSPMMISHLSSPSSMGSAIPPTPWSGWVCCQILSLVQHMSLLLEPLASSMI